MNKKNSLAASLLLFTVILTACALSKSSTPASGDTGKLPAQTQLILGTINLEETDYAITVEQATELLPMFYVLQDLNDSGSAAQEEIDGLVNQIQQTLTDDQIKTIDNMSLSMQDMLSISQGSGGDSNSSGISSTSSVGGGGAGGPPDMGGMPGSGPSGMPGDAMPSAGTTSASSDTSARTVMDTSTPTALFDAVIEILQKKVQ
jgi:hypothetical protein